MDKQLKEKLNNLEKQIKKLRSEINELKNLLTSGLKVQLRIPQPQIQSQSKILIPRPGIQVKK